MTKHELWFYTRKTDRIKIASRTAWQIYAGCKVKQIKHERYQILWEEN